MIRLYCIILYVAMTVMALQAIGAGHPGGHPKSLFNALNARKAKFNALVAYDKRHP